MRIKKILIRGLLIDPIPILQTNITRTIWQTVRRITNEILGVNPWNDEHVQLLQTISINQLHVTKCQVAHGFYLGKVTNSKIS